MKGLLYKDIATLGRQLKFFLAIIVAFAAIPGSFTTTFALIYAVMLPFSAMAYDEQAKWNRLAAMLPYTDLQLVLSKYILGWIGVLATLVIAIVARGAVALVQGSPAALATDGTTLLLSASLALLLLDISLPLLYRFGVERGRLAFRLCIIGAAIGIAMFNQNAIADMRASIPAQIAIVAAALAAVASPVSVYVSYKLCRRGRAA